MKKKLKAASGVPESGSPESGPPETKPVTHSPPALNLSQHQGLFK